MSCYKALLLLTLKFTAGYSDRFSWKLAININADDGHNFGYAASAWDDKNDVGNQTNAFTADYKSYDVSLETANFIAIARHQDGVCEAARVWEFLVVGKTLHEYTNSQKTSRLLATHDNYTWSYISPNMANKDKDPIFAVDGGLVFNWWASNDGVRIGNSNAHCKTGLPAQNVNANIFFGLGNDVTLSNLPQNPTGSNARWFDVGLQDCSKSWQYRAQGTDHGSDVQNGKVYGQYAVYVSDYSEVFPCRGTLRTSMRDRDDRYLPEFDRIDEHDDEALSFVEYIFYKADLNKDGVISPIEFSESRLKQTADEGVDFSRVDKNGDGLLNFDEVEFDFADINNDGELSYDEFYVARVKGTFRDMEQR